MSKIAWDLEVRSIYQRIDDADKSVIESMERVNGRTDRLVRSFSLRAQQAVTDEALDRQMSRLTTTTDQKLVDLREDVDRKVDLDAFNSKILAFEVSSLSPFAKDVRPRSRRMCARAREGCAVLIAASQPSALPPEPNRLNHPCALSLCVPPTQLTHRLPQVIDPEKVTNIVDERLSMLALDTVESRLTTLAISVESHRADHLALRAEQEEFEESSKMLVAEAQNSVLARVTGELENRFNAIDAGLSGRVQPWIEEEVAAALRGERLQAAVAPSLQAVEGRLDARVAGVESGLGAVEQKVAACEGWVGSSSLLLGLGLALPPD
jgi:hypothetical protein